MSKPETATERAFILGMRVMGGGGVSVGQAMDICGMSRTGARLLLERASRTAPLVNEGGVFRLMGGDIGADEAGNDAD